MEYFFIILLAAWVYSLNTRIKVLEWRLDQVREKRTLESEAPPRAATEGKAVEVVSEQGETGANLPRATEVRFVPQSIANSPSLLPGFFEWIRRDFMVKLGALLLILALGWFVSYAIERDWIGPMGQIALGLLVSVAFMMLGVWRIVTHPHQGGIFTVLGSSGALMTLWAAREIYDFFTPGSALFLMALTVVCVAFVSVRHNRNALALSGLVLAAVAPLLTASPAPNIVGLFTYLLVVVLGTLWVVYLRGWSNLTLTAFVIVFLYGLPWLLFGVSMEERDIALFFAFLFTAIFFVANILGLIANENEENRKPHIMIALGTGLYLIGWVAGVVEAEWQSLVYVAWMLVFTLGSYVVYRFVESRTPFYIYSGTSLVLLGAATAAELSGPVLTIALTIEVALLVILVARVANQTQAAQLLSLLFLIPMALSLDSLDESSWYEGLSFRHFFVIVTLSASLAVAGYLFLYKERRKLEPDVVGVVLMVLGSLYGLSLIWLVLHAGTPDALRYPYYEGSDAYYFTYNTNTASYERATTFSLIIYTLIGLVLFIVGHQRDMRVLRWGGAALLIAVVARLLLVEVWKMSLELRIVTFVVVGILLVSTAFIRHRRESHTVLPPHNQPLP